MMFWFVVIGVVLVLAAMGIFNVWFLVRAKRRRMGSRQPISFDDLYKDYYEESRIPKPLVQRLLREVSYYTDIRVGLLRPTDRFDRELKPLEEWYAFDDSLAPMEWKAKACERKFHVSIDLSKIQTLDDYVRTFGRLEARDVGSASKTQ